MPNPNAKPPTDAEPTASSPTERQARWGRLAELKRELGEDLLAPMHQRSLRQNRNLVLADETETE